MTKGGYIMKAVLLAGGFGTRISEESQFKPKPVIEIGGMPILWHIMKIYSAHGINEFIICAGYKQHIIKEWFANYFMHAGDSTFDYTQGKNETTVQNSLCESWKVTVVDTGLHTMTGGRLAQVHKYIGDETFMLTYGDAVCDININELVSYHNEKKKTATLTAITPEPEKGVLEIAKDGSVTAFYEKTSVPAPINAGYMVLAPEVFDYIAGDGTSLESDVLEVLAKEGKLMAYHHKGFWQCMDTMREKELLESHLKNGTAPWKKWED